MGDGWLAGGRLPEDGGQQVIFINIRRGVAFKHNGAGVRIVPLDGEVVNLVEVIVAFVVVHPHDLERAVAFQGAGGIVVDALAGTREKTGRRIAVIHDEVGIRLVALQCHADHHLADGGTGEGIGSAKRL